MDKMLISVVSPVYRAENLLPKLVKRISEELEAITPHYEIILVEDSSPDGSWSVMQELAKQYPKLKVVKLARNFGQQYALAAGLSLAQGEWVATMDCDLQDQPEEIARLYAKAKEGFTAMKMNEYQITYLAYDLLNKKNNDLEAVKMVLETAIEQHPNSAIVHSRWADYYFYLNDIQNAI
jgi:glycosyltransferase involved in cell wall biosynthesis